MIYVQTMKDTRTGGRPRQMWRDNEEDIQEPSATNCWREKIRNRKKCMRTLSALISWKSEKEEEKEEED